MLGWAAAVVGVKAEVPPEARTADTLGRQRSGTGVAIDSAGLVVTIGYLILEATAVDLYEADGDRVPAEEYLQQCFFLDGHEEHALDLVYGEFLLREGLGESPSAAEYEQRFPQFAEQFRLQVEGQGGGQ